MTPSGKFSIYSTLVRSRSASRLRCAPKSATIEKQSYGTRIAPIFGTKAIDILVKGVRTKLVSFQVFLLSSKIENGSMNIDNSEWLVFCGDTLCQCRNSRRFASSRKRPLERLPSDWTESVGILTRRTIVRTFASKHMYNRLSLIIHSQHGVLSFYRYSTMANVISLQLIVGVL